MRLCNFHADTPFRMFRECLSFDDPRLGAGSVSHLPYTEAFELYAIWSDRRSSDEVCWRAFFRILARLRATLSCSRHPVPDFRLTVEDARLLAGELSRLSVLRAAGVSTLTLVWAGESIIGGAHGTDTGLTPFGRAVVRECFALGIVPDISHASDRTADEVLDMAEAASLPVIASHSDFRAVARHNRNLTDRLFRRIADLGGVCGISMEPTHLREGGDAGIDDAIAQIEHGLAIAPDALVFGTDFDGIDHTPYGLPDTAALPRLAKRLLGRGHPTGTIDALFWGNGARFAARYLPKLPLHP